MFTTLLLPLLTYAFVSSVTPGPNNLMLMASGANFGVRRTVPHMLGVSLGFTFMILMVGLGLMQLFDLWPMSYTILKVLSVAYIVWLAWKIAHSAAPGSSGESPAKPFTFIQAAAFQWVNPKAWAMALTAITIYAPGREVNAVFIVLAAYILANFPSISLWVFLGREMRRILTNQTRLRVFNWTMASLLVASLYPVFLH